MKTDRFSGITVLMMILFVGGCHTSEKTQNTSSSQQPSRTAKFSVDIVSDPSGAIIEINDDYIGKTPLTVELEGWVATRTFARNHKIVAHPLRAGGYTQVKIFSGWSEASRTYGDTVPKKIYFNMSLEPSPQKYDVEINKKNKSR